MVTHSSPRPEPSGRRARLSLEPRHDLTSAPNIATQPSSSPGEATICTNVAHNRCTRGITRGLLVQKQVDKDGKLFVPIPQVFRAPVGINASKLASKIGIKIRSTLQDLTVKHWKAIDEGTKAPIVQRITDQFDLSGDPIDVRKEKMVQIKLEHSKAGKDPPTHEHISVEVLLSRSGYVKGLGLRPSSTIRTTSGSLMANDYVACLENKIEAQNEKIAELLESKKKQKAITTKMVEFLIQKGYIEAFGSEDISST